RQGRAEARLLRAVLARARHHLGLAVQRGLSDRISSMSDMPQDHTPGTMPLPDVGEEKATSGLLLYTIGLALAVILTATSFWAANPQLIWAPGVAIGLAVLAVAQIGVHLVLFLHITTGPDNTNNVLALAFGILIVLLVVVGSLWIMTNLNH